MDDWEAHEASQAGDAYLEMAALSVDRLLPTGYAGHFLKVGERGDTAVE